MKPSEYFEDNLNIVLKQDIIDKLNKEAKIVCFSAAETILQQESTAVAIYYIVKGLVRGYYVDEEGNDITKCFCAEGDYCSTEGFRTSAPSTFTIECLENCQCIKLPYKLLNVIIENDKSIGDMVSILFQKEVSVQEEKSRSLMLMTAEKRYKIFCKNNPQLCERVALKHIASYIGVRAASLSRIRKNMSKN